MTVTPIHAKHTGPHTVNVDGENIGWSPMRIRNLRSVLTVLA